MMGVSESVVAWVGTTSSGPSGSKLPRRDHEGKCHATRLNRTRAIELRWLCSYSTNMLASTVQCPERIKLEEAEEGGGRSVEAESKSITVTPPCLHGSESDPL
jgi:hypothetical protein